MNSRGRLHLCLEFIVDMDGDVDEFHEQGNYVMDEMLKLEECNDDVHDSAVSTDAGARLITIELDVTGENAPAALTKALDVTRAAVHAAGGSTPDWPTPDEVSGGPEYHQRDIRIAPTSALVDV